MYTYGYTQLMRPDNWGIGGPLRCSLETLDGSLRSVLDNFISTLHTLCHHLNPYTEILYDSLSPLNRSSPAGSVFRSPDSWPAFMIASFLAARAPGRVSWNVSHPGSRRFILNRSRYEEPAPNCLKIDQLKPRWSNELSLQLLNDCRSLIETSQAPFARLA